MKKEIESISRGDSHTTSLAIKKSETFESSIPEEMRHDPYLIEIFKTLVSIMPTVVIRIIGDYIIHDETIYEYSDRITNKLREITQRRNHIRFI